MWLTLTRFASFILASATGVLIARALGPSHYGELAAATAIVGVITSLGAYGLDQLVLDGSIKPWRMQLRLIQASVPVLFAAIAAAVLLPNLSGATRVSVMLLGAAVLANQISMTYLITPQFNLDFTRRAVREFCLKSVAICLTVISAVLYESAPAVAAATLVSGLMCVAVAFRELMPKALLHVGGFFSDLRRAFPYALSSILFTLYFSVDLMIVALDRDRGEVAMYGVASGVFVASTLIAIAVNNDILRTRIYRARDKRSALAIRRTSMRLLWLNIAVGLAGLMLLSLLREPMITALYGRAYESAVPLIGLLAWAVPLHYFNSWAANVLVGNGRIATVIWMQGTLAMFNIVACVISVPRAGATAAAIVTIVTEGVGVVGYGLLVLGLFVFGRMSNDMITHWRSTNHARGRREALPVRWRA